MCVGNNIIIKSALSSHVCITSDLESGPLYYTTMQSLHICASAKASRSWQFALVLPCSTIRSVDYEQLDISTIVMHLIKNPIYKAR